MTHKFRRRMAKERSLSDSRCRHYCLYRIYLYILNIHVLKFHEYLMNCHQHPALKRLSCARNQIGLDTTENTSGAAVDSDRDQATPSSSIRRGMMAIASSRSPAGFRFSPRQWHLRDGNIEPSRDSRTAVALPDVRELDLSSNCLRYFPSMTSLGRLTTLILR